MNSKLLWGLLASLLFSVLSSTPAVAQSKASPSYKGYRGMSAVGIAISEAVGDMDYVEISTTHGYQFNPYLFVGGGIGYLFDFGEWDFHYLPVFAAVRGTYPVGKKVTPFAEMRLGYSIDGYEGLYFAPQIGATYRLANGLALDFGLGYTPHKVKVKAHIMGIPLSGTGTHKVWNLRIGLQF